MGKGRFSYSNLITAASMLTASSIWPGTVGFALKEGSGSGSMTPSGEYSGTADRLYTIEIDAAGEVGTATFRWRKNTSTGWEASGVATATTDITLEDGVKVRFGSGTGQDFNLVDRWTFMAVRFFAPGKAIDLDPDTPWRSALFSARPLQADVNMEIYDASVPSFTDKTTEAFSESDSATGAFWADVAGGDLFYIGCVVPFDRITVDLVTAAVAAGALTVEYYNGTSWAAVSGLTDGTASGGHTFAQDGDITFTIPSDWAVQGDASLDSGKYYVRLKPAADPTTDPDAERLVPLSLPETLTIDLGSAKQVTAFVLHGHNIGSAATVIQLLANTSDEWGAPAFTQNLTWAQDTIAVFPDQTYRYWQIRVADKTNADAFIKAGEVFLGTHFEPGKNYVLDFEEGQAADEDLDRTAGGVPRPVFRNRLWTFILPYRVLAAADRAGFRSLFEAVKNRATTRTKAFFFTPDSAVPAETYLVDWINPMTFTRRSSAFSDFEMELEERPLSAF